MLNWIVLQGRVTRDPELRKTGDGTSVTTFTVAVDRDYNSGGEKQTDFFTVISWRGTADFVCKYFRKGSMIVVGGRLQARAYEKGGTKRTAYEIVTDRVYFGGDKRPEREEPDGPEPMAQDFEDADNAEGLPF